MSVVLSLGDNEKLKTSNTHCIFLKDVGFFTILLKSQYPILNIHRLLVTYMIIIILSRATRWSLTQGTDYKIILLPIQLKPQSHDCKTR